MKGRKNSSQRRQRQQLYAIVAGKYAVIVAGRRVVLHHESGELLKGRIDGYR